MLPVAPGCGGGGKDKVGSDAGGSTLDAGAEDAAAPEGELDAGADAGAPALLDAGPDAQTAALEDAGVDAGCADGGCAEESVLAPFQLDCAALPANGACQGGPREVLLVMEEHGFIAMFEPSDGHFLGYFKRPDASYYIDYITGYRFATQGPDQCIWTLSAQDEAGVQRWTPEGARMTGPALEEHWVAVPGGPDEPAVQSPQALAFSAEHVFVASTYGEPGPRITRWNLDGTFDRVVLQGADVSSMLVLGDGSLLISDGEERRVARVDDKGRQTPVLGGLEVPGQITYAGDGQLLLTDESWDFEPVYQVDILSGKAEQVIPALETSTSLYGVAPLDNGKWLVTGRDVGVAVLDPASGKVTKVFKDNATLATNFKQVGRACLSEAFLASRAPTPANDTCIDRPAGAALYEEDFETGDFVGTGVDRHFNTLFDHGLKGLTSTVEAGPAGGTRALKLKGAAVRKLSADNWEYLKTGLYARFPAGNPSYIRYRVYVPAKTPQYLGVMVFENEAANTWEADRLLGAYVNNGRVEAEDSNARTPTGTYARKWVTVEMRNVDWSERTYDFYVDCVRVAEAVGIPAGLGDTMDLLDVYNIGGSVDADTVSWIDDILVK